MTPMPRAHSYVTEAMIPMLIAYSYVTEAMTPMPRAYSYITMAIRTPNFGTITALLGRQNSSY